MSITTFILGESGTGKTTALRNLPPEKTILIQATPKPLPFKSSGWKIRSEADSKGNIIRTDNPELIKTILKKSRKEIIIIDDFQYIMANEFMRRTDERGFDKFTEIGRNVWDILTVANSVDDNRRVYVLAHTETDQNGKTKIKTIGKMLDEKITLEGMVTIVLRTVVRNEEYFFSTQNDGADTCKSPLGMFESRLIENDLSKVDKAITDFYEITQPQ